MNYDSMVEAYQDIIRREFKTVVVTIENNFSDEYGMLINAIGIPDGKRAHFSKFVLDTLAPEVEKRGFEFVGVVPYSLEEAKSKFPSIWDDIAARIFIEKVLSKLTEFKWSQHSSATVKMSDSESLIQIPNKTFTPYYPDKLSEKRNVGVYATAAVAKDLVENTDYGMAA